MDEYSIRVTHAPFMGRSISMHAVMKCKANVQSTYKLSYSDAVIQYTQQ